MTNVPAPLLLAPNRPPLLAVLLPKRPAEDAPVAATAGAPIGTISDQEISGVNIVILSEKKNPRLNLCCHNLSSDFWLSLHFAILHKSESIVLCGYSIVRYT